MAYYDRYKANFSIFDDFEKIEIGQVYLGHLMAHNDEILNAEIQMYLYNCRNNDELRIHLPNAYAENLKQAEDFIYHNITLLSIKYLKLYCIRLKENNYPIGYIFLNSPMSENGFDGWSIDYWISTRYSNKGIMTKALAHLLSYLHKMLLPELYAVVNPSNLSSLSVIRKLGFIRVPSMNHDKGDVYRITFKK